jgi:hypothetical protein
MDWNRKYYIVYAAYNNTWVPVANLLNWTEAFQVTKTNDRPDLSSEGAHDIDKTVTVKQ